MPRKIRELIAELEKRGFVNRGGKGSHRNVTHPAVARPVTISGDDAKQYQERGREGRHNRGDKMKESAQYVKIVEWSEEDQCYVGSCPGLLYGGCHGEDEVAVFEQLCAAVDEVIDLYRQDGNRYPRRPAGEITRRKC
jgi:predicted RNA binding protein YcfA (HicA-like mRNA interferase family)/predicted RNase H-like HicB family nuclease